jgi:hypothetical protein
MYAVMAPALEASDRDWILKGFGSKEAAELSDSPWNSSVFWIGADWLLVHGSPEDWKAFREAQSHKKWKEALLGLQQQIEDIPACWASPGNLSALFCDDQTADAFWENPDSCLASWGITRDQLISLGLEPARILKPGVFPKYPREAKDRKLTTTLQIRMLVGSDGKVLWARPSPGYALCFFAPFGLRYAAQSQFQPAQVGGMNRPSHFNIRFPFILK